MGRKKRSSEIKKANERWDREAVVGIEGTPPAPLGHGVKGIAQNCTGACKGKVKKMWAMVKTDGGGSLEKGVNMHEYKILLEKAMHFLHKCTRVQTRVGKVNL